jgi:hypothetical protein
MTTTSDVLRAMFAHHLWATAVGDDALGLNVPDLGAWEYWATQRR